MSTPAGDHPGQDQAEVRHDAGCHRARASGKGLHARGISSKDPGTRGRAQSSRPKAKMTVEQGESPNTGSEPSDCPPSNPMSG